MSKWLHGLFTAALVALMLASTGCNTIRGFGQDVQTGGRAIENVGRQ